MADEDLKLARRCKQNGCTFNQDGKCLEGLEDPTKCPHLSSSSSEEPVEVSFEELIEDKTEWVQLPDGIELTVEAASRFTSGPGAVVVVLAGEPDSGKSTITASLYEEFSRGEFAGLVFAGSETLLALERICYLSRISSGGRKADTERTKGTTPRFFHFVLSHKGDSRVVNLLVTDLSGEAYKRAIDNEEHAKKLTFIQRADKFVLVLDGELLASRQLRQDALQRGILVLRSLLQAGALRREVPVLVVISKLDLLKAGDEDGSNSEFLSYCRERLSAFAKDRSLNLRFIETAARPDSAVLPFGYGLKDLLNSWLGQKPPVAYPQPHVSLPAPTKGSSREADMFLWRWLGA